MYIWYDKICNAHISTLLGAQGANPETLGQAQIHCSWSTMLFTTLLYMWVAHFNLQLRIPCYCSSWILRPVTSHLTKVLWCRSSTYIPCFNFIHFFLQSFCFYFEQVLHVHSKYHSKVIDSSTELLSKDYNVKNKPITIQVRKMLSYACMCMCINSMAWLTEQTHNLHTKQNHVSVDISVYMKVNNCIECQYGHCTYM